MSQSAFDLLPGAATIFRNKESPKGTWKPRTPNDYRAMVDGEEKHADRDSLPLLSFTRFAGNHRSTDTVREIHALALDHDDGTVTVAEVVRRLTREGIAAVVVTTRKHSPEKPRLRIFVPLAKAVNVSEHRRLVRVMNAILGGVLAPESEYAQQAWFYERVIGVPHECVDVSGEALDLIVADYPAEFFPEQVCGNAPASSPPALIEAAENDPSMSLAWSNSTIEDTPTERARAMAALGAIDPACSRKTYLDVVMGMCSTGWHDATDIARTWASGGLHDRDEPSFNERNFNSDVKGLNPDGGITIATLYHLAKLGGFDASRAVPASHVETFGDISNAQRFAAKYRGKLLYVYALRKWLRYDGKRWCWCSNGEAEGASQQIAAEALDAAHAALRADPTDRAKSNHSQALAVHRNVRRHDAMLTVAASQHGMSIASPAGLDTDPYMLGVTNGVVDLRTGGMLTPDPNMLITRQAGAAFDAGAECPQWLAFLEAVFNGDREYVDFLQRVVGYALTGLVDEEVLVFLQGKGANGKSVLGNVLHSIFGDYAVTVRASMLARDPRGSNGEAERDKARLPGARMALINEVGQNDVWNDQMVKELVSRERVAARPLYGEPFEFMPTHTIFVRGNHDPVAMDTGDGFWRRVLVLRFTRQFAEHERVPDLDRRLLEAEREGILAWAVQGCLDWQRGGLKVPASIRKSSEKYRQDSDQLGIWLEDCCLCDPKAETPVAHLFTSYCAFLSAGGMKTPSRPAFGRQLASKGFEPGRTKTARLVRGVALADLGGEWAGQ